MRPGRRSASRIEEALGQLDGARSVDFSALSSGVVGADPAFPSGSWHWIRPPAPDTVDLMDGTLHFPTQAGGLEDHAAGILAEPEPPGDYALETHLRLDLPPDGCCQNSVQAGLVIYGDDGNYLQLAHISRAEIEQIVFTKAVDPVPPRFPREGNTVVGPADAWTYLRIVKHTRMGEETYTAYSSRDGVEWTRGGTWSDTLGRDARIGLVSMGGAGIHRELRLRPRLYPATGVKPSSHIAGHPMRGRGHRAFRR